MKAVVVVAACFCLLASQVMAQFGGYNGNGQYGDVYGRGYAANPLYQRYMQGYGTGLWGFPGYSGRYGVYGQSQGGYYTGSDS